MNEQDVCVLVLKNGDVRAGRFERLVAAACRALGVRREGIEPAEYYMKVNGRFRLTNEGVARLAELLGLLSEGQKEILNSVLEMSDGELEELAGGAPGPLKRRR